MDIIDEIRADHEAGALRLEREYRPQLLAVASRFCPDPVEAEALVYRTMDEAIRRIETLANPDSFFGWMCGIMSNQYGKLNRRKIDGKIDYTGLPPEREDESTGVDNIVRAVDGTILHEAIEHLPPKLKEAVLLRYFADMPLTQIARFLMIPVGTVNSRLHMARMVLTMRLSAKLKKGELWWHDLNWLVREVEKHGARTWAWSDYLRRHDKDQFRREFCRRMPKTVVQNPWMYWTKKAKMDTEPYTKAFVTLAEAGYDVAPCGSNCYGVTENFPDMAEWCHERISPERLKGMIMAPWLRTLPAYRRLFWQAADLIAEARGRVKRKV